MVLNRFAFNCIFLFGLLCNQVLLGSVEKRDSLQNRYFITTDAYEKIVLLNLLAESYLDDNPVKSLNYASQARSLAQSELDLNEKAKALYLMAASNYKQANYIIAYNFMTEANAIFKKTGDQLWYAKSCLELGKINERQYEFEKALEYLFLALSQFAELQDSVKLAETYNILGINYFDQKNYEKAFENFQKAMKIRLQLKDITGLSSVYNNIGEVYRLTNELDLAMEFFKKAIYINRLNNRMHSLAINYNNMGIVFTIQNKYDSANYYLNESLRLSKVSNDDEMITQNFLSLGNLLEKLNNNEAALRNFDSAFIIAQSRGYMIHIENAAYAMSKLHKQLGNYKLAYDYHKLYKKIGDSLFSIRNEERIAQIEMNLIFDHENQLNELRREKTRYAYFLFAFSLLSLLVISILIYGRLRIKNKHFKTAQENLLIESRQLKSEIEYKDRELAANVIYLVKKNELINYISEKLLSTKSVFKQERQESIQEIILELQSSIDTDIWKTFEERFKAVHKDFYNKLNTQFPNLTENDRKLCALLKLNMTTKDIAAITHQNPNSIDVARTRLRKKLNISNQDISLVKFLEDF